MSAQEWADRGVTDLYDDFLTWEPPVSLEKAGLFIRAAYVRGYLAAHTEPAPSSLAEASVHREALALLLPVS